LQAGCAEAWDGDLALTTGSLGTTTVRFGENASSLTAAQLAHITINAGSV